MTSIIPYIIFNQFSTLHNDLGTVDMQIIHSFVQPSLDALLFFSSVIRSVTFCAFFLSGKVTGYRLFARCFRSRQDSLSTALMDFDGTLETRTIGTPSSSTQSYVRRTRRHLQDSNIFYGFQPSTSTEETASSKPPVVARVRVRKQSSIAANRGGGWRRQRSRWGAEGSEQAAGIANFQLMYVAHEGNAVGIREILDAGADPNFRDLDGRRAMHISACEEHAVAIQLLFERGAGCWSESWFFCWYCLRVRPATSLSVCAAVVSFFLSLIVPGAASTSL
jgi:hypothetical protein